VLATYHAAKAKWFEVIDHTEMHQITFRADALQTLDTVGALLVKQATIYAATQGKVLLLQGLPEHQQAMLRIVENAPVCETPPPKDPDFVSDILEHLGKSTIHAWQATIELVSFIGQIWVILIKSIMNPKMLRVSSISRHILETGIHAIPIVSLIAFLISIVLAYQGVFQMRPYGAEHFTANLVSVSVLREMGVLLTAIMMAGRSGSAFTAEIGVMKVNEEVDALRVIGLSPFELLVVPRILALMITLPLLTFIANIMGLAGGALVCYFLIDMNLQQYIERISSAVQFSDLFVGLIKAPVFAFLIGVVGCMRGMDVEGSAESVGRLTTAAVVQAVFLVLIADAIFSILFSHLGI
jgi:phospholipid/cholesterol/gamma-HCH transport system permease protein